MMADRVPTFTGIARCNHCNTTLNTAKGVYEFEKERTRLLGMWNVLAKCEHVKSWPFLDFEIEWVEEAPEQKTDLTDGATGSE